MGYHPRIETSKIASHISCRTRNSRLWFVNNKNLEDTILGYVAKYTIKYEVKLYALALEGNHMHNVSKFPKANRADFTRESHSMIADAVKRNCSNYEPGSLWHRRYSSEFLPDADSIEEYLFYTALQPVHDGLVDKISEYPGYNFFNNAISGIKRKFKVFNRAKYNDQIRYGASANKQDFIDEFELVYERLPGYEDLTQAEYKKLMLEKLEKHRLKAIKKRQEKGKSACLGRENLLKVKAGSRPKNTKTTGRFENRPRVLSPDNKVRHASKAWYFNIYFEYKECSAKYREGDLSVEFPPGTYKPPKFTCACKDTLESIMEI